MISQASTPSKIVPISLIAFAHSNGLTPETIRKYCAKGRILGARKHHLTKQWWIYPPAKIVSSPCRW
jgi:hypothetical protein